MQVKSRRRRVRIGVFLGGALVAIAAACGFPNPTLFIIDPGPDSDGGPDTGFEPDVKTQDAPTDAPPVIRGAFDGGEGGAGVVKDAGGGPIDASGCLPTNCDCDKDTYERVGCGDAAVKDCDDNDGRYRPDQGFIDIPPPAGKTGDWNCSGGAPEILYNANVTCGALLSGCCECTEGFSGNPGCGMEGDYIGCKKGGFLNLDCVVDPSKTQRRVQACR